MTSHWKEATKQAFPDHKHLTSGDPNALSFSIDELTLSSGDRIKMQHPGVTALVGANNTGKSTVLRELAETLRRPPRSPHPHRVALQSVSLKKGGNAEDTIAWLGENSTFVTQAHTTGFTRAGAGIVRPDLVGLSWSSSQDSLGDLCPFLVFYGDAQGRFSIGGSAEMRDSIDDPPQHPIHYLQDSAPLLTQISRISREIFGTHLTLDTLGRTQRLRIGELESESPRINAITREFRDEMANLPTLDTQGDGMRSLMGQLLPTITGAYRVIIIDEPEAFLHPPQAHALGLELGRLAIQNNVQILLATHDKSLLTGLLSSEVDVSVARLTRTVGPPRARKLEASDLRELWSDPVLKYTNVLDGLFHRLVILAEGDGDCAYLQAAMDCTGGPFTPIPRNEILFVPTNGKEGMAKICRALSAVGVPIVAAPDLDRISDCTKLQELVESLGFEWSDELESTWLQATAGIRGKREPAKVGDVLDAIEGVLTDRRHEPYTNAVKDQINAQLRTSGSPWSAVKDHGVGAFKGQAFTAIERLIGLLDDLGIVLVREGELERLAPEVEQRKGPGWLPAALTEGAQRNQKTQDHVRRILLAGQQQLASNN